MKSTVVSVMGAPASASAANCSSLASLLPDLVMSSTACLMGRLRRFDSSVFCIFTRESLQFGHAVRRKATLCSNVTHFRGVTCHFDPTKDPQPVVEMTPSVMSTTVRRYVDALGSRRGRGRAAVNLGRKLKVTTREKIFAALREQLPRLLIIKQVRRSPIDDDLISVMR